MGIPVESALLVVVGSRADRVTWFLQCAVEVHAENVGHTGEKTETNHLGQSPRF